MLYSLQSSTGMAEERTVLGLQEGTPDTKVIRLKVAGALGLAKKDIFGASDPYVRIELLSDVPKDCIASIKTRTKKKTLNPQWDETFYFRVRTSQCRLVLDVFDENRVTRDDFLGRIILPVANIPFDNDQPLKLVFGELQGRSEKSNVKGYLRYHVCFLSDSEVEAETTETPETSYDSLPYTIRPSQRRSFSASQLFHDLERVQTDPLTLEGLERVGNDAAMDASDIERVNTSDLTVDTDSIEDFMRGLSLPEGWDQRTDANGRTYYLNHTLRRTQWEHPSLTQAIGGVPSSVSLQDEDAAERADFGQRVHISLDNDESSRNVAAVTDAFVDLLIDESHEEESQPSPYQEAGSAGSSPRHPSTPRESEQTSGTDDLPFGWAQKKAPNGRVFFINHLDKTTTWLHPVTKEPSKIPNRDRRAANSGASAIVGLGPLPAGWEERKHKDGRTFFIDHNTKTTQWEDPRLNDAAVAGQAVPYNRDYKQKYETLRKELQQVVLQRSLKIKIRRSQVFEDAFRQVMFTSNKQNLRARLEIEFEGEKGLDYGGVSREFFYLLSKEMFNPYYGFFEYSAMDNYTLQINPYSAECNDRHLQYFEFFGRIAGMAVLHGKLLDCFFIRPFYKMLLEKDITLKDMESVDAEYYNSLIWIKDNDPIDLALTFEVEDDKFGEKIVKELKTNGSKIEVTNENKKEYIDLIIKWRFVSRVEEQMKAFKDGFNEVVPLSKIKVFDEGELELLLGGIGSIDVRDWKANTEYRGEYHENHKVIQWFWKLVLSMNNEMRARLLQFATGTSRVPMNGFKELYGSNGPRKFCIEYWGSVEKYPRAHTCFNRIDLPPYETYDQLVQKVVGAVEGAGGFGGVD